MSEPMTREEACEAVQRVVSLLDGALDANNVEPWRDIGKAQGLLASVLAALERSCPICGGRSVLGRSSARVSVSYPAPQIPEVYACLTGVRLFPPVSSTLDPGQWVDVLVFARDVLPADEPQALLASARDVTPPKEEP